MDNDVATLLADLLTGLIPAEPSRGRVGEWIVPLLEQPGRRPPGPAELHEAHGVTAVEERVPAPDRVVVANESARDVAVYAGAVLRGGFADRAVVRTAVVPARSSQVLSVEPLEARWWPAGSLVAAGTVDPVRAILLQLADRRGALAAQARTAGWSVPRDAGDVGRWPLRRGGGPGGWIMVLGGQVAGATLHPPHGHRRSRAAAPPADGAGPPLPERGSAAHIAATFLDRLLTEVDWASRTGAAVEGRLDDSTLRLTPLGGSAAHLTSVRLRDELVVALVRRSLGLAESRPGAEKYPEPDGWRTSDVGTAGSGGAGRRGPRRVDRA
jgi:hypothetical protein